MKITKTVKEIYSSKPNSNIDANNEVNREIVTTYDIDINPEEIPEIINNFIRAGLGDIKPFLNSFFKSIADKIDR